MTQASLSPDLQGALGAPPSTPDIGPQPGSVSEGALWTIALAGSGLLIAALLLLGQGLATDTRLGGVSLGAAIVIAALGSGALAYALVMARRAGHLRSRPIDQPSTSTAVPVGMHVVPARPAERGRRMRQQLEEARVERSRQAKAIASAASATATSTTMSTSPPVPRPVAPSPEASLQTMSTHAAARPLPPPARGAAPDRSAPPAPVRVARPSPPPAPAPRLAPPQARPTMRPAITMPRPAVSHPRPAAWPNRVPVVRMAPPPMHRRTQVATFQVTAANVRAAAPDRFR